jgi:hypothetical protein
MPAALTSPAATPADSAPTDGGDPAHLRRDWTLAVALGELVGFVPPAVTGATLAALGAPDVALVPEGRRRPEKRLANRSGHRQKIAPASRSAASSSSE